MIKGYYLSEENFNSVKNYLQDLGINIRLQEINNQVNNYRLRRKIQHKNMLNVLMNYVFYELFGKEHHIVMKHDEQGKPFLVGADYQITISHSNGYVMLVVANSIVGGDIEKIRYDWSLQDIQKRMPFYLNEMQQEQIRNSEKPAEDAIRAWTRKESYFKVHQDRKVPSGFKIADFQDKITYKDKQFTSKIIDQKMIMTLYHDINEQVEYIEVII